jgi:hypothetical protein
MAFAATTQWEVRTTGSSSNGGGYSSGGVDYSQQDTAQIAYTDLVIDAVTNTNCTSAGNPFTSDHIGNIINITGGTGFTVQRVQVVSVAAGVATCDKSLGTLGSTGGTGNLGGAVALLSTIAGILVAGNNVWIQAGTYTVTATTTLNQAGNTSAGKIKVEGYTTTRGARDGRPIFTSSTNSVVLLTVSASLYNIVHLEFNHTAATRGVGLTFTTSGNGVAEDCLADGCSTGFTVSSSTSSNIFINCSSINCTSSGFGGAVSSSVTYYFCEAINNTSYGFFSGIGTSSMLCYGCLAAGNGSIGFYIGGSSHSFGMVYQNNTAAYNGSHGFNFHTDTASSNRTFFGNLAYGNTGWGFNLENTTGIDTVGERNAGFIRFKNAMGSNSSGAYSYTDMKSSTDVDLTADPFTNSAGDDYSLNNTAGGGADVRAAFGPIWPSGLHTSYRDIGAVQHQDSGGGSSVKGMRILGG